MPTDLLWAFVLCAYKAPKPDFRPSHLCKHYSIYCGLISGLSCCMAPVVSFGVPALAFSRSILAIHLHINQTDEPCRMQGWRKRCFGFYYAIDYAAGGASE